MLLPRLIGHKAMRIVMESARIGAEDGLALGLLD
jgi:enoyl-CoA hydratase/carnithine racemase